MHNITRQKILFSFFPRSSLRMRSSISTLQPIFKKDDTGNKSLRALCLTTSIDKLFEYKTILTDAYGVRIFPYDPLSMFDDFTTLPNSLNLAVDDTNNETIKKLLMETIPSPNFILFERTDLLHAISGTLISPDSATEYHMQPVVNRSTLYVWKPYWNTDGTLNKITFQQYKHRINGYIDKLRSSEGFNHVYGWDAIFVNSATGQSHAQDSSSWGKRSARQLVLDDFITSYLLYRKPQDLKNFPFTPKQAIDFDISVGNFIKKNKYLSNPFLKIWGIDNVLENLANRGLFFKAAISHPMKNYFSPPFCGIPLTAKKTGAEETVFMVHDINHHNIPDLIYDGNNSTAHKFVYSAWRMISEATTMIIADMFYADSLFKSGVNPDSLDVRIYPLFQALNLPEITDENRKNIIVSILKANTAYAVMGDDSLWRALLRPGQEEKLEAFKEHFSLFFIGDHSWTHANYENMAKANGHYRAWTKMVSREQFKRADVILLSDMVDIIGKRGCDFSNFADVVQHIFNEIIESRVLPSFQKHEKLSEEERTSNAFFRYMIGQMSFYAKYNELKGILDRGESMMQRLKYNKSFDAASRQEIRDQFKQDIYYCWGKRVITTAMVANISELHPVFPPVYISYARPQFKSIAEAQQKLYGKSSSETNILTADIVQDRNHYTRIINGITFIDALALERSIDDSIPVKHRLRQKMINAGVEFWDKEQTIVKKPVIGICSIGGFSVNLDGNLPHGTITLSFGKTRSKPLTPEMLSDGLRETMGMQSFNTYRKEARELYDTTAMHKHYSMAHGSLFGLYLLGISKKAELEFDVQRDLVHLARETSARATAQDDPTLVAMTAEGAAIALEIKKNISTLLSNFKPLNNTQDWREERNSLFPLSACVSLGINGTLRNFQKILASIDDSGKELEYRNALMLIYNSLYGLFPELFKPARDINIENNIKPLTQTINYKKKPGVVFFSTLARNHNFNRSMEESNNGFFLQ